MADTTLVCPIHPDQATHLRCNRCDRPMCTKCAVQTPVGYRCRECVKGVRKGFDNSRSVDLPVAALVSAVGTGLGVFLLQNLSFWGLIVAPVAGGVLAEAVGWAVGRRRNVRLPLVAVAGGAAGIALAMAIPWLLFLSLGGSGFASFVGPFLSGAIWQVISGALMISTLFYRLRGIQI